MMRRLEGAIAWLLVVTGTLHSALTPIVHPPFDEDAMWFLGTGLAMTFAGVLNVLRLRYAAVAPGVRWAAIAANVAMAAYVVLMIPATGAAALRSGRSLGLMAAVFALTALSIVRRGSGSNTAE
jgi:hypothetical protein